MKNSIKEKNSIYNINLTLIISLIPLILYGIYKNGFILYQKEYLSLFQLLLLIIMPIGSFCVGLLVEYLFNIQKKGKIFTINSFLPLYGLIINCIINPSINIFLFWGILFVLLILIKKLSTVKIISINYIVVVKIVIILILIILGKNTYNNLYENHASLAFGLTDIIFGRSTGGLFSTNIFLILVALIYLSFAKFYKKEIPFYLLGTYILLTLVITIIEKDNINIFLNISNSMVFFGAVFVAPEMISSPYTKKGRKLYGILVGILTVIFIKFIDSTDGVFVAILIGGFLVKFIDKFFALK